MSTRSKRIWIVLGGLALAALAVLWFARGARDPSRSIAERGAPNPETSVALAEETPPPPPAPQKDAAAPPADSARVPKSVPGALPDAAPGSTLSGRAVDTSGNPLPGVHVWARFATDAPENVMPSWKERLPLDLADPGAAGIEAARSTITDAEGRFAFDECAPGRFRLALRSGAQAPRDFDDLILPAECRHTLPDIELEPGVVFSGLVLDEELRPVAGARVARLDPFLDPTLPDLSATVAPLLATTDRFGAFRTTPLPPGPATLIVCAPCDRARSDAQSSTAERSESDEPEARVEIASSGSSEVAGLRIVLPSAAAVAGRVAARPQDRAALAVGAVRAAVEPSPLPAACRADFRTGRVAGDGAFLIDGLARGEPCELRPISPTQRFDDDGPWNPARYGLAGYDGGLALAYEPDCGLTFEVERAKTRARIPEYTVVLHGATAGGLHDEGALLLGPHADGATRLAGVRPRSDGARITLEVAGDRFRSTLRHEALVPGAELELGPFYVDLLPEVEVLVRDKETGRPISGASVRSIERDPERGELDFAAAATTDAQGSARIACSFESNASIVARAPGFARAEKRGPEIRNAGSTCTIDLVPGTRVQVRVMDAAGSALAGVRVEHAATQWTPNDPVFDPEDVTDPLDRARVTNPAGVCSFANLSPGRHTFRVARAGRTFDGEWKLVDLADAGSTEIVLVTRGFGSIAGLVRDDLRPVAGARILACPAELLPPHPPFVEADRPLPPGVSTTSDSRGRFQVQNLEPGPYVLVFGIEGQSLRPVREVQVDSGERALNVDVGLGTIEGVVEDADGSPAAQAAVWVLAGEAQARLDALAHAAQQGSDAWDLEAALRGFPADFAHPALVADARGRFKLRGLARSEAFTLFAADGPHAAGWRELGATRRPRAEREVGITLEPRGALSVTTSSVRWERPLVLVAELAEVRDSDAPYFGPPLRAQRLRPGLEVALPALEPGTWTLTLFEERADHTLSPISAVREITVTEGVTETIDFSLP